MQDSILGPWDYDLSQRQMLNQLSHPGAAFKEFMYLFERENAGRAEGGGQTDSSLSRENAGMDPRTLRS